LIEWIRNFKCPSPIGRRHWRTEVKLPLINQVTRTTASKPRSWSEIRPNWPRALLSYGLCPDTRPRIVVFCSYSIFDVSSDLACLFILFFKQLLSCFFYIMVKTKTVQTVSALDVQVVFSSGSTESNRIKFFADLPSTIVQWNRARWVDQFVSVDRRGAASVLGRPSRCVMPGAG